jgi:hypothetical protein
MSGFNVADHQKISQTGDNYSGMACRVTGPGDQTSAQAYADSDGTDATSFIPHRDMRRNFILPVDASHVAVVCDDTTEVTFYKRARLGPQVLRRLTAVAPHRTNPAMSPFVSKVYIGGAAEDSELRKAGVFIHSDSADCTVFIDGARAEEEMTVFGY